MNEVGAKETKVTTQKNLDLEYLLDLEHLLDIESKLFIWRKTRASQVALVVKNT